MASQYFPCSMCFSAATIASKARRVSCVRSRGGGVGAAAALPRAIRPGGPAAVCRARRAARGKRGAREARSAS